VTVSTNFRSQVEWLRDLFPATLGVFSFLTVETVETWGSAPHPAPAGGLFFLSFLAHDMHMQNRRSRAIAETYKNKPTKTNPQPNPQNHIRT
jgi:hypothetical protein